MTRLQRLLEIAPELRTREKWLRIFYADVWAVGDILFGQAKTKSERKLLLRKLQEKWVKNMMRLDRLPAPHPAMPFLVEAFRITGEQFDNLFHCFSNPRIPGTNNGTEQLIAHIKSLERQLAKNPNPGARFIRNAPPTALLAKLKVLPGELFIGTRPPDQLAQVRADLKEASRQAGIAKLARRNLPELMRRINKRWRGSALSPPTPQTMSSSPGSTS